MTYDGIIRTLLLNRPMGYDDLLRHSGVKPESLSPGQHRNNQALIACMIKAGMLIDVSAAENCYALNETRALNRLMARNLINAQEQSYAQDAALYQLASRIANDKR